MPKSENKGTLDRALIERALKAFEMWSDVVPVIIPPHLYNEALKQGVNVDGFAKSCQVRGKRGRGAKRLANVGHKRERESPQAFLQKLNSESIQVTQESKIVSTGCTQGATEPEGTAASLEQEKASQPSVLKWDPYLHQLVERQ